jgi:hypothetical protein
MLTKKKFMVVMAIICVMLLSVTFSNHLFGWKCTGRSDCGSCEIKEGDCTDGGCVSGSSGHSCLCDGVDDTTVCEPQQ